MQTPLCSGITCRVVTARYPVWCSEKWLVYMHCWPAGTVKEWPSPAMQLKAEHTCKTSNSTSNVIVDSVHFLALNPNCMCIEQLHAHKRVNIERSVKLGKKIRKIKYNLKYAVLICECCRVQRSPLQPLALEPQACIHRQPAPQPQQYLGIGIHLGGNLFLCCQDDPIRGQNTNHCSCIRNGLHGVLNLVQTTFRTENSCSRVISTSHDV